VTGLLLQYIIDTLTLKEAVKIKVRSGVGGERERELEKEVFIE